LPLKFLTPETLKRVCLLTSVAIQETYIRNFNKPNSTCVDIFASVSFNIYHGYENVCNNFEHRTYFVDILHDRFLRWIGKEFFFPVFVLMLDRFWGVVIIYRCCLNQLHYLQSSKMVTDGQEAKSKEDWSPAVHGTASLQQPEQKLYFDQLEQSS
jgi:hypothetical protein